VVVAAIDLDHALHGEVLALQPGRGEGQGRTRFTGTKVAGFRSRVALVAFRV
jgi:hypothetical protein